MSSFAVEGLWKKSLRQIGLLGLCFTDSKEAILNEDSNLKMEKIGEAPYDHPSTVLKHLKVIKVFQKQGHCVFHELRPRYLQKMFLTCGMHLQRQKR